jgi:histidinol-phosphate aminotransferase
MTANCPWIRPHLKHLSPYTPGEQPQDEGWIKLNTNELPYPVPVEVTSAIAEEAGKLARYPDPRSLGLRAALARHHHVDPSMVIIGNGSDDILNLIVRAFGGSERKIMDTFPSYSLYPILAAIDGSELSSASLGEKISLPKRALLEANPDLLFLTCPNAPTGIRFANSDLKDLISSLGGLVVVDEAYAEFAQETALPLLESCSNLIITRTFSKAFGLAGLRLGYGIASPDIVEVLDTVRDSYNVNRLSQAGGMAALRAWKHYEGLIKRIRTTREHLREQFLQWDWPVFSSEANFLFFSPRAPHEPSGAEPAADLLRFLRNERILLRSFAKHPLTAPYLRVTIGHEEEMAIFQRECERWRNE